MRTPHTPTEAAKATAGASVATAKVRRQGFMGKATVSAIESELSGTVKASRGFKVKRAPSAKLAEAKAWMVAFLTGAAKGKYPSVAFNPTDEERPQNFACMLAVGFGPGWTNDADGSAKVELIQQAYGIRVAGRKLGFPAMASQSATVREKTMRAVAADWIGRADTKGTFHLVSTKPSERVAVRAMRGTSAKASTKATKGTAKAAKATPSRAQRDSSHANGKVTVTVDKALRSSAKRAERAAQRAEARAKQASQGKPSDAKAQALADIAEVTNA